jgi:DTW domain-containing protein YfiP
MGDIEPLKPSNTGWLLAVMVADTFAFGWSRTDADPALLALLANPQWAPIVVFPGEFATPQRLVHKVPVQSDLSQRAKRPLFILLDGTWAEARKMFRKSPYLDRLPVLSLNSMAGSRYQLRRSRCDAHLCTSEVAALCLALAGDAARGAVLEAYLDVYTHHYLQAKKQLLPDHNSPSHLHYKSLLDL